MVNFTNIRNAATAAVGALVISTACIAAAVGPATSAGQTQATYAAVNTASAQAAA